MTFFVSYFIHFLFFFISSKELLQKSILLMVTLNDVKYFRILCYALCPCYYV